MKNCPNCGKLIDQAENKCPNCGQSLTEIKTRAAYRAEFKPEKENSTVQKMLEWIRQNATLVFLLGVLLLILMNFSYLLGWLGFFGLMLLLYVVSKRADKIERYTVDKQLTAFLDQIFSNTFNRVDRHKEKIRHKNEEFENAHPHVKEHVEKLRKTRNYRISLWQLSVILTALIDFVLLFYSPSTGTMIVQIIWSFAGQLLSSNKTFLYALIVYLILIVLILVPIVIISKIFKNTKKSRIFAMILSLLQSIVLIYAAFHLTQAQVTASQFNQITRQLLTNVVSLGACAYLLILDSLITTVLSVINLFKQK